MLKTSSPVKQLSRAAVFSAAQKDQVATWYPSKKHSLFSYFFFKGLQGHADQNNDNIIELKELKYYLGEEVKFQARKESNRIQTPQVAGEQDFIVARFK